MFKPLPLFIGLRYMRAKKRNQFISIISTISFIGIALGVAVLITVMSVMNGFDRQIKSRILMMVPPVKVYQMGGKLYDWESVAKEIKSKTSMVSGYAPIVEGQGLLSSSMGSNSFVQVQGILPEYENTVVPIKEHVVQGSLDSLEAGKFNIILGQDLANSLGVHMGDRVTLIVPQANLTPAGMMPRLRQFTVTGIFAVSYQYDSYYALTHISDAGRLFQMGDAVSALQLGVENIYQAPMLKYNLNHGILPGFYMARDWTDENKTFFEALQMEKTMMFFILMLIIAVAVFNLLSSLVMVVTDKRRDIAIMRTMGMSSRQIITIFIVQGLAIGMIGTAIGIVLGIVLALNATEIVNFIQGIFGVQFLNSSVYQINFIPSYLEWSDILHVGVIAVILSFLATLYPAWHASRVQPVEALRYE